MALWPKSYVKVSQIKRLTFLTISMNKSHKVYVHICTKNAKNPPATGAASKSLAKVIYQTALATPSQTPQHSSLKILINHRGYRPSPISCILVKELHISRLHTSHTSRRTNLCLAANPAVSPFGSICKLVSVLLMAGKVRSDEEDHSTAVFTLVHSSTFRSTLTY